MSDSESSGDSDQVKLVADQESPPATEATDETSDESKTTSTNESKPTATSDAESEEDDSKGSPTVTEFWATPTSGSMQVFDDKTNHILLPGVSNGITYVSFSIFYS